MNTFLKELKNRVLVCDGAMGTMLQQSGLPSGHCPEDWNISNPEESKPLNSTPGLKSVMRIKP
jgi:5-methyltetrahydrofolate--homocysteine methyltransferase